MLLPIGIDAISFESTIINPNTLESKQYKGTFLSGKNMSVYSNAIYCEFKKIQDN